MAANLEVVLAHLPSSQPDERTLVVLCQADRQSHLELRQQTWGEGVGWFNQNTVRLDPEQAAGLRLALGQGGFSKPLRTSRPLTRNVQAEVLRFESA